MQWPGRQAFRKAIQLWHLWEVVDMLVRYRIISLLLLSDYMYVVYLEYCAVPYQTVVKIPSGLTYTDAAGLS